MLFISILLSIWFVLWLINTKFIYDFIDIITQWLQETTEEEIEEDDGINPLLNKTEGAVYHLSCNKCNHTWWSTEANVNFCPHCGAKKDFFNLKTE